MIYIVHIKPEEGAEVEIEVEITEQPQAPREDRWLYRAATLEGARVYRRYFQAAMAAGKSIDQALAEL